MDRNRRWAWCCGGGGGVPQADPALARSTAEDRLGEAKATGAEIMVTSSTLCLEHLDNIDSAVLAAVDVLDFARQAL
jgi:Fe-S oxidoreductase